MDDMTIQCIERKVDFIAETLVMAIFFVIYGTMIIISNIKDNPPLFGTTVEFILNLGVPAGIVFYLRHRYRKI